MSVVPVCVCVCVCVCVLAAPACGRGFTEFIHCNFNGTLLRYNNNTIMYYEIYIVAILYNSIIYYVCSTGAVIVIFALPVREVIIESAASIHKLSSPRLKFVTRILKHAFFVSK